MLQDYKIQNSIHTRDCRNLFAPEERSYVDPYRLLFAATKIITTILNSAEHMPPQMKEVLSFTKKKMKRVFPQDKDRILGKQHLFWNFEFTI